MFSVVSSINLKFWTFTNLKSSHFFVIFSQELLEKEDDGTGQEPKVQGVGLMEVYERLEELGNEDAEARAAVILAGLGFSGEDRLNG